MNSSPQSIDTLSNEDSSDDDGYKFTMILNLDHSCTMHHNDSNYSTDDSQISENSSSSSDSSSNVSRSSSEPRGFLTDITLSFDGFENDVPLSSTRNLAAELRLLANQLRNSAARSASQIMETTEPHTSNESAIQMINSAARSTSQIMETSEPHTTNESTVQMETSGIDIEPHNSIRAVEAIPTLHFVTTNRGKLAIVQEPYGYEFKLNKKTKSRVTWQCKTYKCNAKLYTDSNYSHDGNLIGFQGFKGKHSGNCSPEPGRLKNRIFIAECKRVGKDRPFTQANRIDREIRPKVVPESLPQDHIINKKNMAGRINYARRKTRVRPPKAGNLIEYILRTDYFPDNFYRCDVISRYRKKIKNVITNVINRHFLFFTDDQLNLLKNVDNIIIDATFKIVDGAHTQLFTIHANIKIRGRAERVNCPLAYILMSGKHTQDYYDVMQKIVDILGGVQNIKWEMVVSDYEKAMWKAIKKIFGNHIKHYGCWFHLTQAIFKKVQKLNLATEYFQKQNVYNLVRRFMCLAFLAGDDIKAVYEQMKTQYSVERAESRPVRDLFKYINKFWICGRSFSPEDWSLYDRVTDIRTTNAVENWNGRIWRKADQKKLHIYLLAELLHEDATYAVTSLRQENPVTKSKELKKMESKVKKIYAKYTKKEISPREALERFVRATVKTVNVADSEISLEFSNNSFEMDEFL